MSKYDPEMEARISKALEFISENPHVKIAKVARQFVVTVSRLWAHLQGRQPQSAKGGHNTALSTVQDTALKAYVRFLIILGAEPGLKGLRLAANSVLRASGEDRTVSFNWPGRWLKRNQKWFHTIRAKTLAAERKATHDRRDIEEHFKKFAYALEEFGILQDDCFNFDESGFRIGLNGCIVIIHTNTKAVYLADPDIWESITAIECISIGGWAIPLMLILAGSLFL